MGRQRTSQSEYGDAYAAGRLRTRREQLGLFQTDLARAAGVSGSVVHNYETGQNCIAVSTLWEFAQVLSVPIEYFFPGYEDGEREAIELPRRLMALELVHNFSQIKGDKKQELVNDFARLFAALPPEPPMEEPLVVAAAE